MVDSKYAIFGKKNPLLVLINELVHFRALLICAEQTVHKTISVPNARSKSDERNLWTYSILSPCNTMKISARLLQFKPELELVSPHGKNLAQMLPLAVELLRLAEESCATIHLGMLRSLCG